jgi:hypothetical protein
MAERLETIELRGRLAVRSLLHRARHARLDPRLHARELLHEIADVHDQVALDRKVLERLDPERTGREVAQEATAGKLRLARHHHPAAAADRHAAGPAVGERAVHVILDVLQALQHGHVVRVRNLVGLEARLDVVRGVVAHDLQDDGAGIRHAPARARACRHRRAARAASA